MWRNKHHKFSIQETNPGQILNSQKNSVVNSSCLLNDKKLRGMSCMKKITFGWFVGNP